MNEPTIQKNYRLPESLAADIAKIASEKSTNETLVVRQAIEEYRDRYYARKGVNSIKEDLAELLDSFSSKFGADSYNRIIKALNEMAIQQYILAAIVNQGLDFASEYPAQLRPQAVQWLKENDKVFRLDRDGDALI